ncbi:type IV pilus twitching motility protein PilT [Tissierella creatinophila]|uniref:Twitching mobility protein n=1 Tax=Tissierella creatinophila DSM 6911 TaxID=1123403 RepID=A0A1U7M9N3_TISCR|nr:type IV pilus twitching motility protein PilT [Tissierella creatinophila]OLS03919.1 twitching mobility protein [Tissierella creatinophila DSM 6911]
MNLIELLNLGIEKNASDIHITVGMPPILRINGELIALEKPVLMPDDTKKLVFEVLTEKMIVNLEKSGEIDRSFSSKGIGRYRINAFKQRGSFGMVLRIIPLRIPSMDDLKLPAAIRELSSLRRGLLLVTGPTGSGKSTTLASLIDKINHERSCHILTLEDPIEYLHKHNKSIVNQREIGSDSTSFTSALRSSLRQDPDVILVGEMRDLETISIALTAAETGHLVLSTLHTSGAAKTIDRIIDVFPPHQQQQIRVQLSSVLQGVISQQLLPTKKNDGRIAAFEIMMITSAIRNLIREDKIHQIDTAIQTGASFGMMTMDTSILNLYKNGFIDKNTAIKQAINESHIKKYII